MTIELRAPTTDDGWTAYHDVRRRVLFELRGNGSAYDPSHPDEHRANHYPFVLWVDDTAVGAIRVDIHGDVAIFRRVAIRDDVQRRGFGRRMLEAAEQFARRQACTRIDSHVDRDAIGFYERCGFARADAKSGGAVLMTKALA
jgi:GNAT superfamily N-acetyltransferase